MKPRTLRCAGTTASLATLLLLPLPAEAVGISLPPVGGQSAHVWTYSVTVGGEGVADRAAPADTDALDAASARSGKRASAGEPAESRALLQRARGIEKRLIKAANLNRNVEVGLDPSNEVNAWTDGSTITVTAGLLRFVSDDDELASVLAHETGHIVAHHPQKVTTAQIAAVLGTLLAGAAGGRNAEIGTSVGSMLALKKYSRDEEAEADRIGLGLTEGAGYDGSAMARFFASLEQLEIEDPGLLSSFMIDHPTTAERIHRLKTYPRLDPDLPDNQFKLEQGLIARGSDFEAVAMARSLAARYPDDPRARDLSSRALASLKTDYPDAGVGSAVSPFSPVTPQASAVSATRPPSSDPKMAAFRRMRQNVRAAGYGLYDAVDALQGLELQPRGYNSRYASDISWDHILQSAWSAVTEVSGNLDPAAAALMSVQRGSALLADTVYLETASDGLSPADRGLLAQVQAQRELAARELDQALLDAKDSGAACAQDMHDIGRGVASLEESLEAPTHDTSAFMTPQSSIAWFSSGAGGVARLEAWSAIRGSAEAQLRLEIADLDWRTRSLSKTDRDRLLAKVAQRVGATGVASSDQGMGEAVLALVCAADASAPLPTAYPSVETRTASGGPLDFRPIVSGDAADPVSVLASTRDIDLIQTLYRPAFTFVQRELSAAAQLSGARQDAPISRN